MTLYTGYSKFHAISKSNLIFLLFCDDLTIIMLIPLQNLINSDSNLVQKTFICGLVDVLPNEIGSSAIWTTERAMEAVRWGQRFPHWQNTRNGRETLLSGGKSLVGCVLRPVWDRKYYKNPEPRCGKMPDFHEKFSRKWQNLVAANLGRGRWPRNQFHSA